MFKNEPFVIYFLSNILLYQLNDGSKYFYVRKPVNKLKHKSIFAVKFWIFVIKAAPYKSWFIDNLTDFLWDYFQNLFVRLEIHWKRREYKLADFIKQIIYLHVIFDQPKDGKL